MREIQSKHRDGLWRSKSYMEKKKKVVMMREHYLLRTFAMLCLLFVSSLEKKIL